ncbi:hypothetical protein ACC771_16465, partial [Rhizobium ruizarguesonis]
STAGLPRHRIPALELRRERPQLGAYAQAAVIPFEAAFFVIALLFVAPAPILSCLQSHPQQNWTPIMSRKSNDS